MADPRETTRITAVGEPPDATSIQILLAEYAMLQASLKVSWDLTQQRTATFFTVLSATAVAIGLVVQASGAAATVVPFILVALAIALFVGLSTFLRVVQALQEVTIIILGMNRIRRFMRDAAPRYSALFSLPVNDDEASLHRGVGGMHGHGAEGMRRGYGILQVPGVIAAVNAALAGLGAAVVAAGIAPQTTAVVSGVVVFAAVLALSLRYWQKASDEIRRSVDPLFPSRTQSAGD